MTTEAEQHVKAIMDICADEIESCKCMQELLGEKISTLVSRRKRQMSYIIQELECLCACLAKECKKNEQTRS